MRFHRRRRFASLCGRPYCGIRGPEGLELCESCEEAYMNRESQHGLDDIDPEPRERPEPMEPFPVDDAEGRDA